MKFFGFTPSWSPISTNRSSRGGEKKVHDSLKIHVKNLQEMCEDCWKTNPKKRPNIDEIVERLADMHEPDAEAMVSGRSET